MMNMKVLWVRDGKIGHEKQVNVLLEELSKSFKLEITEVKICNSNFFTNPLKDISKNHYDLIIGAGHKSYSKLLKIRKNQKINTKTVAVLSPTFNKNKFDIICAPNHDSHKLSNLKNVIYFEGALAKVSTKEVDENIVMIAIGGKSKHYKFDNDHILSQINYFLSVHSNKTCYIFNSRRTPKTFNQKIESLTNENKNIVFNDLDTNSVSIEDVMHNASAKLISRDSINMIFESLSSKGKTYIVDMESLSAKNKIEECLTRLINNRQIGYIECRKIIEGLDKMQLIKQNPHHEVFAEVEKVAYKIKKIL